MADVSAVDPRLARLREKASALPRSPGVYIMHNSAGAVIYVGKSRSLRDRVYQYFVGSHDVKTARMASCVNDFRFITCETEIESLALENSLIKQYTPKYNVKLKDAKSYPYIKITADEYPRIVVTRKREKDGGTYFGPYSGTSTAYAVTSMLGKVFSLPSCKKNFPDDIGKGRPCMYYQTGRCSGLCTGKISKEEYVHTVSMAKEVLRGHTAAVSSAIEKRMFECAEAERFEEAANCRDSLEALRRVKDRQIVVGRPDLECDVISLASSYKDGKAAECVTVFYIRDGYINDTEHFVFGEWEITENEAGESPLVAFVTSLYQGREYIPKRVWVSADISGGDEELLSDYLSGIAGRRVSVKAPERGDGVTLCSMARDDAVRHIENVEHRVTKEEKALSHLALSLGLEVLPSRIEAYDISNIGNEFITAGMVVYEDGRQKRSDYRYFRIKSAVQDDYASMREALVRRFSELEGKDESFSRLPDLLMIDGGEGHLSAALEAMETAGVSVPVCGMVKDTHHKTRALVTVDGEVGIARQNDVFRLVYGIQEEVHRFTVSRMSEAKRKTVRRSTLENIPGIGRAKAKALLAHFGKLTAIKEASPDELAKVKGITSANAENIYSYYREKKGKD